MMLKLHEADEPEHEPPTRIRCPGCGCVDTPGGFDVLGADEDHVFCLRCGEHFDPDSDWTGAGLLPFYGDELGDEFGEGGGSER